MHTVDTKDKFIELRAKGLSFDKIAKELSIAKQTLVDWSRELQEEIASRKALELEAIYEKYYLLKERRLEVFGELLAGIGEELQKRDLSDVPTDKLLALFLKYHDKAQEEYIEPAFKTSQEIKEDKLNREILEELASPLGGLGLGKKLKAV